MTELLIEISKKISPIFFLRQTLVVIALFVIGFVITYCLGNMKNKKRLDNIFVVLLAFPVGISTYTLSGLLLLILNIRYTALSVSILTLIIMAIIFTFAMFNGVNEFKTIFKGKESIIISLLILVVIVVSVSGIIPIAFTNDSMYYYSTYPHELAKSGVLSFKYDTFLTDAGQGTAVINTIPFLFGFNESFGIHNLFNINFILFFFYAVYKEAEVFDGKKKQITAAILVVVLMISSMPFVIISKWILANMYFMELMFICLYLNYRFVNSDVNITILKSLLVLMLSFVRIEGSLFTGFLVLVYLMQKEALKKDVVLETIPVAIMQSMYFIRIYVTMHIFAPYTFMSKEKALVAVAFNVLIAIYGLVFAKDSVLPKLKEKFKWFNPVPITFSAIVAVNILLALYDRSLFISNFKSFVLNFVRNSGWGFFPAVVVILILFVPKVRIDSNYFDYFFVGFALLAVAACFARGDELRVDLYDSGNRVMLQIVPFIIFAFGYRIFNAFYKLSQKEHE